MTMLEDDYTRRVGKLSAEYGAYDPQVLSGLIDDTREEIVEAVKNKFISPQKSAALLRLLDTIPIPLSVA